jgi:hypothetical protein
MIIAMMTRGKLLTEGRQTWDFAANGDLFCLTAEAYRTHLVHLFDPVLAVHTSLIEPLPTRSRPSTAKCLLVSPCATC